MHIWRFGVAANSLSGDLKHMSHLQKTLMPFVLVCLLVHLCGVSDALLRSSCAMTDCDLFLIGFSFGSLVCTVFFSMAWQLGDAYCLVCFSIPEWVVELFASGIFYGLCHGSRNNWVLSAESGVGARRCGIGNELVSSSDWT